MSNPSSIYLSNTQLEGLGGNSISLNNSALISTSSVISANSPITSTLNLINYDQSSPNLLINQGFQSGDFTGWSQTNCVMASGTFGGLQYMVDIQNNGTLSQTIAGFTNKNPVFTFWHIGNPIYCNLELDDNSDVLQGNQNRIFPKTDVWTLCSIGLYSGLANATKAKITMSSYDNGSYVTNCFMQKVDGFACVSVGDSFGDYRNSVNIYAQKLFLGNASELPSSRPEGLDIRYDAFIKGDLNVNGIVRSNIIYPQPSLQAFAINIIFTPTASDSVSWSSAVLQLLDTTSYGIASGSLSSITSLNYLYLDLDISTSILQNTTTYTTALGNRKIIVATVSNNSTGFASVTILHGQQSIIGNSQYAQGSITYDKLTVNSLSAITANLGAITAGTITLGGSGSYINMGTNPPITSTGGVGLSGLFQDYTGIYSLNGTTVNASLTSLGLSAGPDVKLDNLGLSMLCVPSYTDSASIKFYDAADPSSLLFKGIYSDYFVNGDGRNIRLNLKNDRAGAANEIALTVSGATSGFNLISLTSDRVYIEASVGVGIAVPNTSAILDLTSTTKAFMPPRMTTTQRNAVSSPTSGMVIYNSTTNKLNVYGASSWEAVTSA